MSMSYGISYNIFIKGKKEELKKLNEIASDTSTELLKMDKEIYHKYPMLDFNYSIERCKRKYQEIEEKINKGIEKWKEIGIDEAVISISYDADDCSHCIIGNYLNTAEEKLNGISIAAYIHISAEEYSVAGCIYSEDVKNDFIEFGNYNERYSDLELQEELDSGEIFPKDADWIPKWMKEMEYKESYGDEVFEEEYEYDEEYDDES